MKPEDQNPTTNPVAPTGAAPTPDSGTTPDLAATASDPTAPTAPDPATTSTAPDPTAPVSTPDPATQSPNSLSAADQLAAAQENLTAAAAVVSPLSSDTETSLATPSLDLTSSSPAASSDADASQPIFSEPLQPAAPVPGSIGSVTSVPPVDTPAPTDPSTDNAFATAAAAEPAATHFNPFAQPAPDASTPTTNTPTPLASSDPTNPFAPAASDPTGLNPAFQPATSAKPAHTGSKLSLNVKNPTLLLGIAAGIFFVAAVVFAILFINALNNKEVVYYPEVVEPEPEISTLSCTQTQDLGYLAGYATPVNGTRTIVATYTDDDLTALTVNYQAVYVNEADANLARTNLESSQSALIAAPETSFTAEYRVDGAAMFADIQSIEGQLTNDAAETLLFGSVSGNPEAMARPSLSTSLSAAGAVCTVE